MRIGILFSSGKDSTGTLWQSLQRGDDVACLMSLLPDNPDSYMFQTPSEQLLRRQAESLRLPLLTQRTAGEKEAELADLEQLIARAKAEHGIEAIGVGALASDYQNDRVKRICDRLGLTVFAPYWHKDQERHLRDLIDAGFDIRMTRIAADGLDASWLGKRLTHEDVDRLVELHKRLGINIAGEGGEFETIVLDGPNFSEPISIEYDVRMESENRGELEIRLCERNRSHR